MTERATFIQAAIPKEKGPAKHIETDGLAMTSYRIRDGVPQVEEIHTPQATLQRVHEVMHARHSSGRGHTVDYPGVNRVVAEIVEDCRLHLKHWPWRGMCTPPEIAKDVKASINAEIKDSKSEAAKKLPPFARFGTNLRAKAVGMGAVLSISPTFEDNTQRNIADIILDRIINGHHQLAAAMLHKMFYPEKEDDEDKEAVKKAKYRLDPDLDADAFMPMKRVKRDGTPEPEEDPIDTILERGLGSIATCKMEILPLTEPTIGTTDGWRMATTGSRIHRPALRRPVLPQRLFMKRSPQEPGGAIIFDASSSMHVNNDVLKECCRRAPTAAVAFYRGNDYSTGKIWVFAYNGMRAKDIGREAEAYPQGNSVDGQAIDWLLAQDGPRIMVTDRAFCGSGDSIIQKQRLKTLEETGQIQVYESYAKYKEAYPVSSSAV